MEYISNSEKKIQKIEDLLTRKNISYKIVNYSPNAKDASEAATQIGLPLERIIKSLVFKSGNIFIILLIPSPKRVNIQKVSLELSSKISMASPKETSKVTGYKIGAVTVFELKTKLPIYIDSSVMEYDKISIASGTRGIEIILSPNDLKEITEANVSNLI